MHFVEILLHIVSSIMRYLALGLHGVLGPCWVLGPQLGESSYSSEVLVPLYLLTCLLRIWTRDFFYKNHTLFSNTAAYCKFNNVIPGWPWKGGSCQPQPRYTVKVRTTSNTSILFAKAMLAKTDLGSATWLYSYHHPIALTDILYSCLRLYLPCMPTTNFDKKIRAYFNDQQ